MLCKHPSRTQNDVICSRMHPANADGRLNEFSRASLMDDRVEIETRITVSCSLGPCCIARFVIKCSQNIEIIGPVVSYILGKWLQFKSVLECKVSFHKASVQTPINAIEWISVSCAIERKFSQLRSTSSEFFEMGCQFQMPDKHCKRSVTSS